MPRSEATTQRCRRSTSSLSPDSSVDSRLAGSRRTANMFGRRPRGQGLHRSHSLYLGSCQGNGTFIAADADIGRDGADA
jgi:hypothetical protein